MDGKYKRVDDRGRGGSLKLVHRMRLVGMRFICCGSAFMRCIAVHFGAAARAGVDNIDSAT